MGTESRRPPNQFIPPVPDPYQYIIFRASEVKDLAVDEPLSISVHDDPAVVGASAPMNAATAAAAAVVAAAAASQTTYAQQALASQQQQRAGAPTPGAGQPATNQTQSANPRHTAHQARRTNSITSATASLETVERALGDLRVGNTVVNVTTNTNPTPPTRGAKPPRRNGAVNATLAARQIPTEDFDFESSNARFDKAALAKSSSSPVSDSPDDASGKEKENVDDSEGSLQQEKKQKQEANKAPAYDPKTSFFDTLSPGPAPDPTSTNGARGRGRGVGRNGRGSSFARTRREEERQRNVATFGEPGGVGLMGPGAYVGGWGRGYGSGGGGGRGRGRNNNALQGTA